MKNSLFLLFYTSLWITAMLPNPPSAKKVHVLRLFGFFATFCVTILADYHSNVSAAFIFKNAVWPLQYVLLF